MSDAAADFLSTTSFLRRASRSLEESLPCRSHRRCTTSPRFPPFTSIIPPLVLLFSTGETHTCIPVSFTFYPYCWSFTCYSDRSPCYHEAFVQGTPLPDKSGHYESSFHECIHFWCHEAQFRRGTRTDRRFRPLSSADDPPCEPYVSRMMVLQHIHSALSFDFGLSPC